jgi:hypothetical protein
MPRVLNIDSLDYKLTPGAVYIGRAMPQYGLPGSNWCNPFEVDSLGRSFHEEGCGKRRPSF